MNHDDTQGEPEARPDGEQESETDDRATSAPATSGHSDADSQVRRNQEDESPA